MIQTLTQHRQRKFTHSELFNARQVRFPEEFFAYDRPVQFGRTCPKSAL
jgi:hypothetical protein